MTTHGDHRPRAADEPAMRADAQRNRRRLLDSADAVFHERGLDASFDEIARRAGLGNATLYRHFPDRDALIGALVCESLDAVAEAANELAAESTSVEALIRWLWRAGEHASTYGGLAERILGSARRAGDSPLLQSCERANRAGDGLLTKAIGDGMVQDDITSDDVTACLAVTAYLAQHADTDVARRHLTHAVHGFCTPMGLAALAPAAQSTPPASRRSYQP